VFQVFSWLPESKAALRRIADFIATRTVRTASSGEASTPAMPPRIEAVESAGAGGA